MAFTVRMTHGAVSGELREPLLATPLSEHYFLKLLRDFGGLGCQNGVQKGVRFRGENPLKSGLVAKRAQRGDEGRKMEPKCSPRGLWGTVAARRAANWIICYIIL